MDKTISSLYKSASDSLLKAMELRLELIGLDGNIRQKEIEIEHLKRMLLIRDSSIFLSLENNEIAYIKHERESLIEQKRVLVNQINSIIIESIFYSLALTLLSVQQNQEYGIFMSTNSIKSIVEFLNNQTGYRMHDINIMSKITDIEYTILNANKPDLIPLLTELSLLKSKIL